MGWRIALGVLVLVALVAALAGWRATQRQRLAAKAARAGETGDWATSARLWRQVNESATPTAESLRQEAQAALAAGRAGQAERALLAAVAADPTLAEPWLLLLELFRLEDRPLDAQRVGWNAYNSVAPGDRRSVLRGLTLALLADTPDDLVRSTLGAWTAADTNDLDARVALARRQATAPRDGDPPRSERIARLREWLASNPNHVGLREALVLDLAEAGEPDAGKAVLEQWPDRLRDVRYHRLLGRWQLDYEAKPEDAIASLRIALEALPHDWRTRYRLARALEATGRREEARAESVTVNALREALDPASLGPRLDADLERIDTPEARIDLANLCRLVGLKRLADAWLLDAEPAR